MKLWVNRKEIMGKQKGSYGETERKLWVNRKEAMGKQKGSYG